MTPCNHLEFECDRCHHFGAVSSGEVQEWLATKGPKEWELPVECICCGYMNYLEVEDNSG
jgi:hypothetical protein